MYGNGNNGYNQWPSYYNNPYAGNTDDMSSVRGSNSGRSDYSYYDPSSVSASNSGRSDFDWQHSVAGSSSGRSAVDYSQSESQQDEGDQEAPTDPDYYLPDDRSQRKTIGIPFDGERVALTRSHDGALNGKGFEFPRGKAKKKEKGDSYHTAQREVHEETGYRGLPERSIRPFEIYDENKKAWLNAHIVLIPAGSAPERTPDSIKRETKWVPWYQVRSSLDNRLEMHAAWNEAEPHIHAIRSRLMSE